MSDGFADGLQVEVEVGFTVGMFVGDRVEVEVGFAVGMYVGDMVGFPEVEVEVGIAEGDAVVVGQMVEGSEGCIALGAALRTHTYIHTF